MLPQARATLGDNVVVLGFARLDGDLIVTSRLSAILLFCCTLAAAQTAPTTGAPPAKAPTSTGQHDADADRKPATPPPASTVGEDETVITVPGVCPPGTAAQACSTNVTRGDFERLLAAMNPNIPAEARRSIAASYGQLIALAAEAQKLGVDKDPKLQIQMRVQAMSAMAQGLQKKIYENSKPTAQEIESYHTENSAKYEELNLRRIVVLKSASSELKPEELKTLASNIRERAAAGEDPDKLQAEAYKTAKSAGAPPDTSLGWKRRGGMDPRHEPQILQLKAGEVSPVMEDGQAFYIYKVDSKRLVPIETVQKEIESTLQADKAKKTFQQLTENTKPKLNDEYFGPEPPANKPLQNEPPANKPSLKNPPPK